MFGRQRVERHRQISELSKFWTEPMGCLSRGSTINREKLAILAAGSNALQVRKRLEQRGQRDNQSRQLAGEAPHEQERVRRQAGNGAESFGIVLGISALAIRTNDGQRTADHDLYVSTVYLVYSTRTRKYTSTNYCCCINVIWTLLVEEAHRGYTRRLRVLPVPILVTGTSSAQYSPGIWTPDYSRVPGYGLIHAGRFTLETPAMATCVYRISFALAVFRAANPQETHFERAKHH